jgi:1-acyl-sn-glycerol-3-phosphate acyltransferase
VGAVRRVLVWVFQRVVGVYFRRIEVLGEAPAKDVGGRLFVSNHVNAIVDPILVLTTAPCDISPVAKSTLWKVPGLRWLLGQVDAVQIVRRTDDPTKIGGSNDQVFDHVGAWLQRGGNILIFPEGTSHSEPHLAPVKTGAARMLLRAREMGGPDRLSIQSVALQFDDREKFRSRVLILYGPVHAVRDFPGEGDDFVAQVTERIRADLSELLVEGASWDEFRLIARVAEMLAHDAGDPTLAGWNAIGRQVEAARKTLAGDERTVDSVSQSVAAYHALLDSLGLTDADIAGPRPPTMASLAHKLYLLLTLPFAAVGFVAYAPPYWATSLVVGRVKSRDETSTIKLGAGLVLYPVWAAALVTACLLICRAPWSLAAAALALVSPFAAVAWRDATPEIRRSVRASWSGKKLEEARAARAEAMRRIKETQSKLGL